MQPASTTLNDVKNVLISALGVKDSVASLGPSTQLLGSLPELDSMGATFIAWGPAFRHEVTIEPVENVHIYNLLCATLGVTPAPNDGDDRLVKAVLNR